LKHQRETAEFQPLLSSACLASLLKVQVRLGLGVACDHDWRQCEHCSNQKRDRQEKQKQNFS